MTKTKTVNLIDVQPTLKTVHITSPATGENIGLSFDLMSQDDPRLKKVQREIRDDNSKKTKGGRRSLKAVDIEQNELKLLASSVTAWKWDEGVYFEDDKVPDFNIKNIVRVFVKLSFVKNQLIEEIEDNEGFFRQG